MRTLLAILACFAGSFVFVGDATAGNPAAAETVPLNLDGLELVWSVKRGPDRLGRGIAADPSNETVFAVLPGCKACAQISAHGHLEREFSYRKMNMLLRTAHLRSEAARDLLFFMLWAGSGLVAADTNGNTLWTHTNGQGIDDVWAADLDGDGFDEVIIGYNGSTGVHVLDRRGKLLWKNQQIANVWHVSAADLDGDGKPEVITTSAKGKIAVFKSDGARLPDITPPPGYYGNILRPIKLSNSDRSDGILITGAKGRIAAMRGDGEQAWELKIPPGPSVSSVEAAPDKPWLAVLCGSLLVVDTFSGTVIAKADRTGSQELCWLPLKGENAPLLVLSTAQSIDAFRIVK